MGKLHCNFLRVRPKMMACVEAADESTDAPDRLDICCPGIRQPLRQPSTALLTHVEPSCVSCTVHSCVRSQPLPLELEFCWLRIDTRLARRSREPILFLRAPTTGLSMPYPERRQRGRQAKECGICATSPCRQRKTTQLTPLTPNDTQTAFN